MQKTVLTKAVAVALATLGAGAAFAQSSLTIYGNADVSLDHVKKTAGVRLIPALAATQGSKSSVTRVSPSGTSQTSFGFKGTEDLGDGYKAGFVLEGQLNHDTGGLSQDGRIFGRQSYVGLTTPFGEVRLGRQYAPIFYSTAFVTTERFGATDLFIEGGASNNLHVRWDNQISYWLKTGGLTASVAYSPNAGSLGSISAARAGQVSGANGGILGAASAGATEGGATKTGRAAGLFANYAFTPEFNATIGLHRNEFDGARYGIYSAATNTTSYSAYTLDRYHAFNIGAKLTLSGITLDAAFGQGKYTFDNAPDDLKLQFVAVGAKFPLGGSGASLIAQASQAKFKNFTEGKNTGLAFGADYDMSKRTTLYTRIVQIRDDEGQLADAGLGAPIQGGPDVIATSFGFRETPVFAGAGLNPGGKSTYIGFGVRHTF